MGVLAKDQVLDRSTLLSEFLKQFNEEKLVVLTGRSFQTLMIRCVKKDDLRSSIDSALRFKQLIGVSSGGSSLPNFE